MYSARDFIIAPDVDAAHQLMLANQKNRLLAGGMWLRLGKGKYQNLIDGSQLGLNYIRQNEEGGKIHIGAFTDLRAVETSPLLQQTFPGLFPQCVEHIVGVQFRNLATIGGNVFCKHGFSDIIPVLLVLNCSLRFYKRGEINLADYLQTPFRQDILLELVLPAKPETGSFLAFKHTATDFSLLNVAATLEQGLLKIAVGARPAVAKLWQQTVTKEEAASWQSKDYQNIAQDFHYGSNLRASAAYRKQIAPVLLQRCLEALLAVSQSSETDIQIKE